MITLTTFGWVPPFAQGVVRDLRVRWALEEAGLPYQVRAITFEDKATPAYRALQPFGQVPAYQEDGLELFESGAIVGHIASRSETLMPVDPSGRARTLTWMFAALNSMEPAFQSLVEIDVFHPEENWARERRPGAEQAAVSRLSDLGAWLEGRDFLEGGRFSAGDLLMTTVLRILRHTDLVARQPVLAAYQARCEARPAFEKALADQLAMYQDP